MIILTKCQRYTVMTMLHRIPWLLIDRKAVLILQKIPLCHGKEFHQISGHFG